MTKLTEAMSFFCEKYPYPNELSKARLTKMVYLADWFSCQRFGKQITDIEWFFHQFGPYVSDIENVARTDIEHFYVEEGINAFGALKETIRLVHPVVPKTNLEVEDEESLTKVIWETKDLSFGDFIQYVYATYPVRSSDRMSSLNLVECATQEAELERRCSL